MAIDCENRPCVLPSGARREATEVGKRSRAPEDGCRGECGRLGCSDLLAVFLVCSVVGLAVETLVSYPVDGEWKDRAGLLWGPFSPIYGAGGVLMSLVLKPLERKPMWVLWATAAVAGGAFEYFAGWFWETAFGIVAWSYEGRPFDIGGHTCLGMAVVWGFAGLSWVRWGLPAVVGAWRKVPGKAARPLAAATGAFLAIDVAMTVMGFSCWFDRQSGEVPDTPIERYFEANYGDAFMAERFQTMSIYVELAKRPNGS